MIYQTHVSDKQCDPTGPGRVQRALLRERNETRDPARDSRSAILVQPVVWSIWVPALARRARSTGTRTVTGASCRIAPHERIDVLAAERPVVVEIGNDRLHERRRKPNSPLLVAEVIVKDRQRQLLRAVALIGPLEAEFGEEIDLIVLDE